MFDYREEEIEDVGKILTRDRHTKFIINHVGVEKISGHAKKRQQQRGIPRLLVDLIVEFGTQQRKPGEAIEISLTKSDKQRIVSHLKFLINKLDKAESKAILESEDGSVITVYIRHKPKGRINGKRN